METKEYWVRITDVSALMRCASFGLASYKVPIVKVRDNVHDERLIIIDSVFQKVVISHDCFLLREHTEPLSLAGAIHLDIKDKSKKEGLCADCLISEIPQMLKAVSHDSEFRRLSVRTDYRCVDRGRFYRRRFIEWLRQDFLLHLSFFEWF